MALHNFLLELFENCELESVEIANDNAAGHANGKIPSRTLPHVSDVARCRWASSPVAPQSKKATRKGSDGIPTPPSRGSCPRPGMCHSAPPRLPRRQRVFSGCMGQKACIQNDPSPQSVCNENVNRFGNKTSLGGNMPTIPADLDSDVEVDHHHCNKRSKMPTVPVDLDADDEDDDCNTRSEQGKGNWEQCLGALALAA